MKDRIKLIRKKHGLTQVEFGEKIGVKGNTVTNYETGLRNPTDAVIKSICREFNINDKWLRTGEGDMCTKRTRNQEIADFANEVMDLPNEDFKKRFIEALIKLDSRDWTTIQKIVDNISAKEDN